MHLIHQVEFSEDEWEMFIKTKADHNSWYSMAYLLAECTERATQKVTYHYFTNAGGYHAEQNFLKAFKDVLDKFTFKLYMNYSPCAKRKKDLTTPCCLLLVKAFKNVQNRPEIKTISIFEKDEQYTMNGIQLLTGEGCFSITGLTKSEVLSLPPLACYKESLNEKLKDSEGGMNKRDSETADFLRRARRA